MKRWLLILLCTVGAFLGTPKQASAYFSFDTGLVDNDHLGYGFSFGLATPVNVGFEAKFLSYYDSDGAKSDLTWLQTGFDFFYDFNQFIPKESLKPLHPKLLVGFGYASKFASNINISGTEYGIRASNGPGMNFGAGFDWKIDPHFSVGLDLFESIHWMDGSTVAGTVVIRDETNYGFNALLTFKIFD